MALSNEGHRVFRVNAGLGWTGKSVRESDGSVSIRSPRPFHGVPEGVSDLIGICKDGTFLAVEVKTDKGRPSLRQTAFIKLIRSMGGRAGIARSVEEALEIASSLSD